MTYPRSQIINLQQTPYYHCVSRCVRRSFLCGKDSYSGKNYEHRRDWVEQRLLLLSEVFTIDVFAYAVMHNHTHLVLYVDIAKNEELSDIDVMRRWSKVRRLDPICSAFLHQSQREQLSEFEVHYVGQKVKLFRERLASISWFMSLLNHYIACKANKEDECTGRFWEGRFKSQALLTEKAVLACLAYVDLNPIRAGVSNCLLNSHYTSIARRLKTASSLKHAKLLPMNHRRNLSHENTISTISLRDYIKHLETIYKQDQGLVERTIKLGSIEIEASWIDTASNFEEVFSYVAGSKASVAQFKRKVRSAFHDNGAP